MAVDVMESLDEFDAWYHSSRIDSRTGCRDASGTSPFASEILHRYRQAKREMDGRVANYGKLVKLAGNEVISPKPDLPNVSSGETSGLVRRMARNLVQHTPNVEVVSVFDDDSAEGIFVRHVLTSKIIGTDLYSGDMQQNLYASTKTALTLGFACVVPVLLQDATGSWYVKYDPIHYRDVFPEPGASDVRDANEVFVRRYLTPGDVRRLIRDQVTGWDIAALRALLRNAPPAREMQSVSYQDAKHHTIPNGYEIITWYASGGSEFLTFSPNNSLLLRIEKNKHPFKQHPVHFLILEKDEHQPLGVSQVELLLGRQEFQDLMLNGAMKLWYRNINPSIIGYGTVNAAPNLSPGKFTPISNPNARLETFEVNTQTLLQYGTITQQNSGAMVQLIGSADQQMAQQNGASHGMSATPQGVEAQQQMVDITTNNFQKAIESFFSHFCAYSLMLYFHELKATKKITVSADARKKLLGAGLKPGSFNEDGSLALDFGELATSYFVRCVPGSLVELEDEKQLRILQELFVPLSQALPAFAAAEDKTMLRSAAATMQYIMKKVVMLSGSQHARELEDLLNNGDVGAVSEHDARVAALEDTVAQLADAIVGGIEAQQQHTVRLQDDVKQVVETQGVLLKQLGVGPGESEPQQPANTEAML